MQFRLEIILNASRLDVWEAFDNPGNLPKWQPNLRSFHLEGGLPGRVGAVSQLVYEEDGRETVLTESITERAEPYLLKGMYEGDGLTQIIKNTFSALSLEQTRWVVESEIVVRGFFRRLMLRWFSQRGIMARMQADMQRFKEMVESAA